MADQQQASLAARVEAVAPASAADTPSLTPYVVVRKTGQSWDVIKDRVTCRNGEIAIREVVEGLADVDQAGVYIAIPARSWNPVKITPKTVTTLEIEAAP